MPGLDSLPRTGAGGAYIHAVTGDFFETVGMDVLRGRGLNDFDDTESAQHVAVVNETMARLVWPETDALGGCLIIGDAPCASVVGIVADHHRFELEEDESMHYYPDGARPVPVAAARAAGADVVAGDTRPRDPPAPARRPPCRPAGLRNAVQLGH